jgi:putative endonuclease
VPPDPRSRTGLLGERAAARHLRRSGHRLIECNYRTREGEIDLIALAGRTLVFVEVKTLLARPVPTRGPVFPLEGIRPTKRLQVRRIARSWLAQRRAAGSLPRFTDIRFDAIGVSLSPAGDILQLEHLAAAF